MTILTSRADAQTLPTAVINAGRTLNWDALNVAAIDDADVTWNTPSVDSKGSMPLGNGDIGLNVWVGKASGDLLFYLSRSDTWTAGYNVYSLPKIGRVRVHFTPNSLPNEKATFRQTLRLRTGDMTLQMGAVALRLWADASRPVVRMEIDSRTPMGVQVKVEPLRLADTTYLRPDVMLSAQPHRIA